LSNDTFLLRLNKDRLKETLCLFQNCLGLSFISDT